MQIIGVHLPLDGSHSIFVGRSIAEARLHSRTQQEHGIAGNVVVSAILALSGRLASELAAEQYESIFQQPCACANRQ